MTWTTTPPTGPGYYWLRVRHNTDIEMVEVSPGYTRGEPDVLYVWWCGHNTGIRLTDMPAYREWAGPLVPPGELP